MKVSRVALRIAVHAAVVMVPPIALGGPAVMARPRGLACAALMLLFGEAESATGHGADASRAGAPGTRLALVSALALLATAWASVGLPGSMGASAAPAAWWLGTALVLVGIALRVLAMRALGSAFTSEIVKVPGRDLVTRGIYAWLHHPSEVGLLLAASGIAWLGGSVAALVVVVTVLAPSIAIRIFREDRALGRRLLTR